MSGIPTWRDNVVRGSSSEPPSAPTTMCDKVDQFGQQCYLPSGHSGWHCRVPPSAPAPAAGADNLGRICEHRQLARQCPHCDASRESADQAAEIARLTDVRDALVATIHVEQQRTRRYLDRAERAEDENAKLRAVIEWALGERERFPDWPDTVTITGNPKYWWRIELRDRYNAATKVTP